MHVDTDTRSSLQILCWSGFLFYVYADTDPDADPDQTFDTDADPDADPDQTFHTDADPDPEDSFQKNSKLLKYKKIISYSMHFWLDKFKWMWIKILDPAYKFDVDPNFYFMSMQMRIKFLAVPDLDADPQHW